MSKLILVTSLDKVDNTNYKRVKNGKEKPSLNENMRPDSAWVGYVDKKDTFYKKRKRQGKRKSRTRSVNCAQAQPGGTIR